MPNYYTPRNQANANNSKPNPNNRLHQQQQQQQQQSYEVYEGRNAYNAPEYENDYESDRARGIGVKGPKNNAAGQGIPISRKAEAKNVYKGDMNQQHKEKRSSGSNNIPTSTSSNRGGVLIKITIQQRRRDLTITLTPMLPTNLPINTSMNILNQRQLLLHLNTTHHHHYPVRLRIRLPSPLSHPPSLSFTLVNNLAKLSINLTRWNNISSSSPR